MKTAAKICFVALALTGGSQLATADAFAQVPGPSSSSVTATSSASASTTPVLAAPTVKPPTAASLAGVAGKTADDAKSPPAIESDKDKDKKDPKSDMPASPKVPDSVKDVVKHLTTATKDVTLEDLNAAREAVVKLDVLIDIEKRLNDLASLRKEREEKSVSVLASALPASALGGMKPGMGGVSPLPQLPSSAIQPAFSNPGGIPASMMAGGGAPSAAMSIPQTNVEVVRVVGSRGHYIATIKEGDGGKAKSIREGDKLSDGSVVASVSRYGVVLSKDKKTRSIEVKDVPAVFNGK